MAKALAIASIVWPALMGFAVWDRVGGHGGIVTLVVYAAGSRICHQKVERSFHTDDVAWPVCARCSGLYASAPFGAVAALLLRRRRAASPRYVTWLAIASVPTALTLGLELAGLAAPSNLTRAIAALPAGAMIAFVLVRLAAGEPRTLE
jgi:uncharacterized membrane protein